jgi:hypothetical protein
VRLDGDWEATIGLAIRAHATGDESWSLGGEKADQGLVLVNLPIIDIPLPQLPLGAAGVVLHTANSIQLNVRCGFSGKATVEAVAKVGLKGHMTLTGDYTASKDPGQDGQLTHDFTFSDPSKVPLTVDVTSGDEADVQAECHVAPAVVLGIQDTLREFRAGIRVSAGPYVSVDGSVHSLDEWSLHTEFGRSGEIAPFVDITGIFIKKYIEQSFPLFRTPLTTWDATPATREAP